MCAYIPGYPLEPKRDAAEENTLRYQDTRPLAAPKSRTSSSRTPLAIYRINSGRLHLLNPLFWLSLMMVTRVNNQHFAA